MLIFEGKEIKFQNWDQVPIRFQDKIMDTVIEAKKFMFGGGERQRFQIGSQNPI